MNIRSVRAAMAAALFTAMGLFAAGSAFAQDTLPGPDGKLGKVHAAEGYKCTKCHTTAKKSDPIPQETCLACHGDGDAKKLAAKTAGVKPVNPHENRHYGTQADCGLCHKQHQPSVNFCADCHPRFDLKVK